MIHYQYILRSVVEKLHAIYPAIPVYGDEVKEGYKTPCFFIELLPIESETETKNFLTTSLMIIISYFSDCEESLKNLEILADLKCGFGIGLKVQERHFTLQDSISEKVEDGVYQFSFNITYKELINFDKENELIQIIEHNIEGRNE